MANDALDELTQLGDEGLRELLTNMAGSASRIACTKYWAGSNPLGTPAALEEFVSRTIDSVISGNRPWSRSDGHTLRQHLFKSLQSEIANLATAKDNDARCVLPEGAEHEAPGPSPEILVARRQFAEAAQQELFAAAADDDLLREIAELFLEGYEAPNDFATKLNVPKARIDTALQKLRRRLAAKGALPRLKEMTG